MCGIISTANSSPALIVTFGFRTMPTPAGVPVMINVPGGSVVLCDKKLTSLGMLKIRSLAQMDQQAALDIQVRPE